MEVSRVRWKAFSVVFFVLLMSGALAASTIVIEAQDNHIFPGEVALFDVRVTNDELITQTYSIYSLQRGGKWAVDPRPLSDRSFDVGAGETYETQVVASVLDEDLDADIYALPLTIESNLGDRYEHQLSVYLEDISRARYSPSISGTVDMDERITPGEPIAVKLFLENRNPLSLDDLELVVQSEIDGFAQELDVSLNSLERKTVEFTLIPGDYVEPRDSVIFFVLRYQGQAVKVIEQRVSVEQIEEPFSVAYEKEESFLKAYYAVTITNEGNIRNSQEAGLSLGFFSRLVSSSEGHTGKLASGERGLVWDLELSPGEVHSASLVVNYRVYLYLLVLLLVFALFYWYVQTPLHLAKKAVTTRSDSEGALSEIKVTLEVRNKSSTPLRDVTIIDQVPGIANVEKSLSLGTLKPTEIRHLKGGTKVVWTLSELDAHEHRLITYRIRAKLNIVGAFSLPRATAEFRKKGKRLVKSYSNIFRLEN